MSNTPRTDKEAFDITTGKPDIDGVVMADFARELELELNEQVLLNGKGSEREYSLLGKIERLERENAELRTDVYCCPPTSENDYEGFKWSDACEELENENAALRADKERLDWLEANSRESIYGPSWRIAWEFGQELNLRAVIDAARKEAQP